MRLYYISIYPPTLLGNAPYRDCNTEGQVIYKVESPWLPFGIGLLPITLITCRAKTETTDNTDSDNAKALSVSSCPLAEIDLRSSSFILSRMRYKNGINMYTNDFFRKTGIFR